MSRSGPGWSKRIPTFAEVQTVVYRQDLLEAAGIPSLQRPLPMDRYIETAGTLHRPSAVYGTLLKGGPPRPYPREDFLEKRLQ